MKTSLVRIGNSRGVRIPKPYLQECGLEDEVVMEVRDRSIVISGTRHPRAGWEEAFRKMARQGDDVLIDNEAATAWDEGEWEWK